MNDMWQKMLEIAGNYHCISNGTERTEMINIYCKLRDLRNKYGVTNE